MKKIHFSILALLSVLIVSVFFPGCGKQKPANWQKKEGLIWNTSYHITYNGPSTLEDSIIATLARVGNSLSVFDTTSLVSRVNRGDTTPVNTDFIRVYVTSKQINKISGGMFDPTLSPLITAWGFGKGHQATPDTVAIDSILQFVGIRKTHLRHDAIVKDDPRIEFNFSAIAKGYGCDAVAEMFQDHDVSDFIIEIGGEIRVSGKNPTGGEWRVSIDKPLFSEDKALHESQEIIAVTDMGIATSGNYRNFHKSESGEVYGHVISPVTGRPVISDVISATVLAQSAMEADALATAFMVMGKAKAEEINNSLRLPVMLVLADSTIWTSDLFDKLIHKN